MTEIFSDAIEVMLIIAALVVLFCMFKYPKEIFITMPKAFVRSLFNEITFDVVDIFGKRRKRTTKRKSSKP